MNAGNGAKRIAIYGRVSTDEQAREGISLEEQRERLRAYCRAMGWSSDVVEFIDDGYSAKNMERPALQRILREVKSGTISKLMVTKLDRLSRRLLDLLTLIELFHHHGVSFTSTTESFDTDTPSGRLTLQVLGAVAEFERERIRERVIENMRYAARGGKWLTQHPYGYRLEEKQLVVYDAEAEIVRTVYNQFLNNGLGYLAIARRLNEAGISSRQNKQWSVRAIKLMLTNPAYIGTLVWNRTDSSTPQRKIKDEEEWIVIPDSHPPIVDRVTWDQVQQRIATRPVTAPRAKTSPHLLGGFLKCGKCGAAMSIGWSGHPKRVRVYRCSAYSNKGTCQSKPYRADEVEEWFLKALTELALSVDESLQSVSLQRIQLNVAGKQQQKAEAAKARYLRQVEAYTAGLIELDQLAQEKSAMERAMEQADAAVEEIGDSVGLEELEQELKGKIFDVRDAISTLPIVEAKAKLRTLVQSVILHGVENIEIVLTDV
jgi:site-specific DNA recombinase